MNNLNFWSEWDSSHRLSFKILAVLALVFIIAALVIVLGDISYLYNWQVTGMLKRIPYSVHSNHSNFIESIVNVDISLLYQKVSGGYQLLDTWMVYAFASVLYLGIMGCLTVASHLGRFWYIVSMGLLIVVLATSGISSVGVLGLYEEYAIAVPAVLFVVLSYYFQTINTGVSSLIRFAAFVAALLVLIVGVSLFSEHQMPLLHVAYYSYWPAMILSIVFALLVGHEIVYAILVLTTQDTKGSGNGNGNGLHFVVLSLVYLLNVGLVYMHNAKYIDWDIYYVNPFLLLAVSTVLGVWGLKGRSILYDGVLPFRPYMIWLYCSLAIVCFSTLIFFSLSGNDPAIEVLEDAVIFGHIGFGGLFFIYIIANFVNLLLKGLPIYRIAFKEDNFPYATAKLGGTVIVMALFFASNYTPFTQAVSGFCNELGDFQLSQGNVKAAKSYYDKGSKYGNTLGGSNNNHRSNFMLASMSDNKVERIGYWKNAVAKKPTPYAFASLGLAYERDNQFFEAVFAYQDGLTEFPKSWGLMNNLALLYDQIEAGDSSRYYLTKESSATGWEKEVLESNLLAIAGSQGFEIEAMDATNDRLDVLNNQLAKDLTTGHVQAEYDLQFVSSTLNLFSFSYLRNLGLVSILNGDRTFLNMIDPILLNDANADFDFELKLIKGLNLYSHGDVRNAFDLINQLKANNQEASGLINALLGKWSMELGSPFLAANYFEVSREWGYPLSTADLVQAYAATDRVSVGQYLLANEIEATDSSQVNLLGGLQFLAQELGGMENLSWSPYPFEIEEEKSAQLATMVAQNHVADAKMGYLELGEYNPFYEKGVLEAVAFFNDKGEDRDQAYGILVDAVRVNEYSALLIKAYIEQCLKMGLVGYAESTVIRLIDVLPLEEYQAYEVKFEDMKSAAQANLEDW
ncbi:MAG: hypothetical protein OCD76_10405 [Reichenbachiella sp.]